jgi:hypothetical protein
VYVKPAAKPLGWADEDDDNLILSTRDPVANIEFNDGDETPINGISEYGYGFWSKWLRTFPAFIPSKGPWYNMVRLTINRNHADNGGLGDRTLAIWLG